jgi:hypothetical protein
MSVVDFLFGGKAPTAGSSTTTTSIQLPAWYNEYASDILGKAKAIGDLPYATYTGPRIADFTATEREGFEKAKTAAGAYKPSLKEAYDALGASKMPFLGQRRCLGLVLRGTTSPRQRVLLG